MTKPRRRKTSRTRRKAPAVEQTPVFTVKLVPYPAKSPVTVGQLWDNLIPYVVKFPSDWWQAFKERWFPAWLVARFPVQYTEHRYSAPPKEPPAPVPEPRPTNPFVKPGDLVAAKPDGTCTGTGTGTVTTAANTETSQGGIVFGTALGIGRP